MVRASGAYRVLQEAGTGVRVCIYCCDRGWVGVSGSVSFERGTEREGQRERERERARTREKHTGKEREIARERECAHKKKREWMGLGGWAVCVRSVLLDVVGKGVKSYKCKYVYTYTYLHRYVYIYIYM